MKLVISIMCVLLGLQGIAQKDEWKENYESTWENHEGGTKLITSNYNPLPITFVLDYQNENLRQNISNGEYVVVPAYTRNYEVTRFRIVNPRKKWNVANKTLTYYGDLTDTIYDADYVYDLPFEKNNSFKVGQGYNGNNSHSGKLAIDFDMPVGTPIMASREGKVVELSEKNSKNCGSSDCADFNNYVKILHADGTIMQYLHLQIEGVQVDVGDEVQKGDLIAYSGNTGWSTGPHLHIDLYLTDKDNNFKTLETKFKIQNGKVVSGLENGKLYLKDY